MLVRALAARRIAVDNARLFSHGRGVDLARDIGTQMLATYGPGRECFSSSPSVDVDGWGGHAVAVPLDDESAAQVDDLVIVERWPERSPGGQEANDGCRQRNVDRGVFRPYARRFRPA